MSAPVQPPCSLIGYVLYPKDIDSYMWDDFREFKKCERCGFRTEFLGTNSKYRPIRTAPDFGATWDGEYIVTRRFKNFCEAFNLAGLEYFGFRKDTDHFQLVFTRIIKIDQMLSKPVLRDGPCQNCGQSRGLHWEKPWTFSVTNPLEIGFYRSDVLTGWDNDKRPLHIVSPRTRQLLESSDLTGFHSFEAVYAPATPALEAAIETYPSEPTRRPVRAPAKAKTAPRKLDLQPLISLLAAPNPGFRCYAAKDQSKLKNVQICHELGAKPSPAELAALRKRLGSSGKLLCELWKHYDGMVLYRDMNSPEAGIRLFPMAEWTRETEAMLRVFATVASDDRPEVIERCVAIGEPPASGHHFLLVTKGRGVGSVLLTNHETLSADEFAADFNDFLKTICAEPLDLLVNQLGNYVRYSDGKTRAEWIPEEYLPDITAKNRSVSGRA
jgi:hypothetical protein